MSVAAISRDGPEALVLGVGNLLWADEGFGVRCVERFAECFVAPDTVEVLDGGTQGLSLVNTLAEARRVLIFDAVDVGAAPGALIVARGADVPRFVAGKKVSLHQTSMMEVLALAELMAGGPPSEITLIGCQPRELEDYGGGLRACVAAQVDPAVEAAAAELARWGLACASANAADLVMPGAVGWRAYEDGRPSEDDACRVGDDRVLARRAQAERGA